MNYIELWHGGRDLEFSYKEFGNTRKNRWEHGPGLYLTTHYDRARNYAKGGGKTYLVTVEEGNNIDNVLIDISLVNEFVANNIIKSKQKSILDDLYENMNRTNTTPSIHANVLVNLIINLEAISNTKTKKLNQFLVENNVDYGIVNRYSGREENVMVIFNNKKIKSVKFISAKDVLSEDYIKSFDFKPLAVKMKP